jgi:hypothetical protein
LPTPVVGGVSNDGYSNRGEVLICISFIAMDGEHFFMCVFGHLNFFF